MSDVHYGVLLSGGLDSSVTGYSQKYAQKRIESGDVADVVSTIALFSVGLEGSPDLAAAQSGRS
jgi:asparagine synthetase B (glutamine-hydrolysing)